MIDSINVKLTKKQYDAVQKFLEEHRCEEFIAGAVDFGSTSKVQFIVGSTSIGPTLDIRCAYCGHTENITDVDIW